MTWEYISGFFDADGSVSLCGSQTNRRKSPQVSFHNNELTILVEIRNFIQKELGVSGSMSKRKKKKEHHGQQYDLKYVDFPKCVAILSKISTAHPKKKHRIEVIMELSKVTPRNGKYNTVMLAQREQLESKFFM